MWKEEENYEELEDYDYDDQQSYWSRATGRDVEDLEEDYPNVASWWEDDEDEQ